MRMEAKNSTCKQIALSSNFKNVPYSVARRHQRLLCAHLQSSTFFDTKPECGPGMYIIAILLSFLKQKDQILFLLKIQKLSVRQFSFLVIAWLKMLQFTGNYKYVSYSNSILQLCRPKWIIYMVIKYTCLDYVVKGWQSDDLPIFGQIKDIIVVNDSALLFCVQDYETAGIDRHYHSFSISVTGEEDVVCLPELVDHHTFYGHLHNGSIYITLRSHIEKICF